jgi:hypothetical protein
LIQGLGQGAKGYLIHISGTAILKQVSNGNDNEPAKIYHDNSEADVAEIVSFDLTHFHKDTEEAIRTAAKAAAVPFAILCPPTIYGTGKGAFKTRSIQIPFLIEAILKRGRAFQVLEGQGIWDSEIPLSSILISVYPGNVTTNAETHDSQMSISVM